MQSEKDFRHPRHLSGVVSKLMHKFGLAKRYDGWMVVTNWSDIVGPMLAEKTCATRFEGDVLHVAVEDDSWRVELSMQLEQILQEIHKRPYGRAVKKIRLERGNKRN